jgi:multiple antibiotic resistance protein
MGSFANTLLLVFAALMPVVNPVGSAPIFLALTEGVGNAERNRLSFWVSLNSFILLFGSAFIGSDVLEFFGISLPIVRIAGGLLLTGLGWKLLNADPDPDHAAAKSSPVAPESFYPLTMPLTVGPGCMAIAITLGTQRAKFGGVEELLLFRGALSTGLLLIALSIYLCYRFADRLVSILGHGGTTVVIRLSAFILVCIGLQILWSGWSELNHLVH